MKLAFDDFDLWIDRFASYPMVQLIDLDAAMGQGENRALIEEIAKRLPCQVGGGIRSVTCAEAVLAAGARRVIIGSALFGTGQLQDGSAAIAHPLIRTEFAQALMDAVGRQHLVFSVDSREGRVAVKGWKEHVDLSPEEAMEALEAYCSAFLYTHIDREGTMQGFPLAVAERLRQRTKRQLIVAGGIRDYSEIEALAEIKVDAVAGMAVYSGRMAV